MTRGIVIERTRVLVLLAATLATPALGQQTTGAPGAPVDLATARATAGAHVPAVGACEVVLFSPDHGQSLAGLGAAGVRKVVDVWAARTVALFERPEIEYVLVFENRGREVGATIDHPHGQIYGYPFVPPQPAHEAAVAREHGCPLCEETRAEAAERSRVVYDDGEWLAWVPYASGYAYGLRIAPRAHHASLPALDSAFDEWLQAPHDGLARAAARVQSVVADELPYIPLVTPNDVWVSAPQLDGYLPYQANLYPLYQPVQVAQS